MSTNSLQTVRLHRILRATPERVYRAFIDPDARAKWLPPHGFVCKVEKFEAKVGGVCRLSFVNFSTGRSQSFGGTFTELTPNRCIRSSSRFDDPSLAGEMQMTVNLKEVSCGTELHITQELPGGIPTEGCYVSWQQSLVQLAHLVEPEIPDQP